MGGLVTFLSDFGLVDPFVGLCHAVLARLAPDARVVDLTHAVPPQDVARGAALLADCVPFVPGAVHLAVVDPGVGTARRGLALEAGAGEDRALFVGPDNGLLWPAALRLGGICQSWELTNPTHRLPTVSATFHGRDVFAPAAAHLVNGGDPAELGPPVAPEDLVALELPTARPGHGGRIETTVRDVDRYGNVQLAVLAADAGWRRGRALVVQHGQRRARLPCVAAFADVDLGALALVEDAFGWLALVRNGGDAAATLGLRPGDHVDLVPADRR